MKFDWGLSAKGASVCLAQYFSLLLKATSQIVNGGPLTRPLTTAAIETGKHTNRTGKKGLRGVYPTIGVTGLLLLAMFIPSKFATGNMFLLTQQRLFWNRDFEL